MGSPVKTDIGEFVESPVKDDVTAETADTAGVEQAEIDKADAA